METRVAHRRARARQPCQAASVASDAADCELL